MSSTLITMEPEQARAKLKAYRADRHKDAEEVYRQCEEAYEELAKGTPLLELTTAIREGGFDEKVRPRLAIARADMPEVHFLWATDSVTVHYTTNWGRHRLKRDQSHHVSVDLGRNHGRTHTYTHAGKEIVYGSWIEAYARIPMVPADVRPRSGQLKDWFVLWEVLDWSEKPHTAQPPRDPYLLRHIGGDLYAVLAEWDLTDLERAIMRRQVGR